MNRFTLLAALGAASLAGCGDYDRNEAAYDDKADVAYGAGEGEAAYGAGQGNAAYASRPATNLPEGTRVVVEEGMRYRIDPGGARVRIGDDESVTFVEDGVRYRIDPGATRVRVDEQGVEIRTDDANVRLGDEVEAEIDTNR